MKFISENEEFRSDIWASSEGSCDHCGPEGAVNSPVGPSCNCNSNSLHYSVSPL